MAIIPLTEEDLDGEVNRRPSQNRQISKNILGNASNANAKKSNPKQRENVENQSRKSTKEYANGYQIIPQLELSILVGRDKNTPLKVHFDFVVIGNTAEGKNYESSRINTNSYCHTRSHQKPFKC